MTVIIISNLKREGLSNFQLTLRAVFPILLQPRLDRWSMLYGNMRISITITKSFLAGALSGASRCNNVELQLQGSIWSTDSRVGGKAASCE